MFNRLIHKEDGVTMVLALAFMAISVPIITAALGLASTLTVDSTVKSQIARDQFSQIGADELGIHQILNPPDEEYLETLWLDGDGDGLPDGDTIVTVINDDEFVIDIDPGDPNISPIDGEGLVVTKTVFPFAAPVDSGIASVHTYTIRVENTTVDRVIPLNWMHDGLPEGFTYIGDSVTSPDFDVFLLEPPLETWRDKFDPATGIDTPAYLQLSWDLNPVGITLQPGEVLEMSFDAQATYIPVGHFCNIAWVEPEGSQTRTGATARISVGDPPEPVCASEKGDIDTSVAAEPDPLDPTQLYSTYVVPIKNTSNQSLHVWWVRLKLPDDFIYIAGSTAGNITANDPLPMSQQGRRQVLNWIWDNDKPTLPSWADDRYITFDAIAPTTPGTYFVETTVFFKEFDDQAYGWPDAVVKVMDTYEITVTDGGNSTTSSTTSSTVFLLGSDAEVIRKNTGKP
ncbi:MAG: hypothetical protein IH861_09875 [Chloroflexi bacterium]|nr:hypothetical protein [Chloroflexota bacterium]